MTNKTLALALGGALVFTASQAIGGIQMTAGVIGNTMTWDETDPGTSLYVVDTVNDIIDWEGSKTMMNMWTVTWDLTIVGDPSISGVIGLTNNSAMVQDFVFSVSQAITGSWPVGSEKFGSSTLSVTDANNNGFAQLATVVNAPPVAVYQGLLDGVLEQTLFDPAYALTVNTPAGGNVDLASFSGFTTNPLTSTMGLTHSFSLTPGDNATANSTFVVIPEPASVALLALGSLVALRRR